MRIVDIVNKDNVTLERCDQEPIHIPGTIQPHGYLLSVDVSDQLVVKYCSANCEQLFNKKVSEILGKSIKEAITENTCLDLRKYLLAGLFDNAFSCKICDDDYNVSVHSVGHFFTLEFEKFPDGASTATDQFNQTKRFLRSIQNAETFQQICQSVADETRAITGYDRVMIYRFDKDYNGEVYAESLDQKLSPFLGHHYPHTDIPAQARELYLKNLLRIIPDVAYTPVPVFTLDDPGVKDKQLDMSESILRSVSPIHIQYLKNMGVAATLTISLVENKRLWGLIACHHYSPRHIPFYTRLAAQLQGHFLTSQISVREAVEQNELTSVIEKKLEHLLHVISKSNALLDDRIILDELMNIVNATGLVLIRKDTMKTHGIVPTDDQIRELLQWLMSHSKDGNFTTDRLPKEFAPALEYGRDASGLIYFSLGEAGRDAILWFRPELDKTINWAGNPTKALATDGGAALLTPRKSFELWQEKVKHTSTEWMLPELNVTVKLAHILQRQFHSMYLEEEERRYLELNENLKKANAELANINWIGTHDLKEPLRKIQVFASRILRDGSEVSPEVFDIVTRMKKSATRMQSLITDIIEYSKVNTEDGPRFFENVDLNVILREVTSELDDEINETGAEVVIDKMPVISAMRFQVVQLFVNLLDNALKFAPKNSKPVVRVSYNKDRDFCKITISDNGIGFDNAHRDKIFEVFHRINGNEYPGTGIGLAICKKIMENHGGKITANGSVRGATFELSFPARLEVK